MFTELTYPDICISATFPMNKIGVTSRLHPSLLNVLDHAVDATDNACNIACDTDFYGYESGTTVKVVELPVHFQLTTFLSTIAVPGEVQKINFRTVTRT